MEESILNKVRLSEREADDVRLQESNSYIKKTLNIAKISLMVPYYFLLMSGLKLIDKKDRLQKKESRKYYF